MSVVTSAPPRPPTVRADPDGDARPNLEAAIDRAVRKIAPLWPLEHFVAVNPFLGLADRDFAEAARTMARVAGARMTLPRSAYAEAIASGRIAAEDLAQALAEAGPDDRLPRTVAELEAAARDGDAAPAPAPLPSVADVAGRITGRDWSRFVVERISDWAAAYFDTKQAGWRSPWRHLPAYAAWREEARHDRTPELSGIPGFRAIVAGLPDSAPEAIAVAVERLGVPADGLDDYLHRMLASIGGWAGFARYLGWERELRGQPDEGTAELLAVRLAWEIALLEAFGADGVTEAWRETRHRFAPAAGPDAHESSLPVDLVLQSAYERAAQRTLFARLESAEPPASDERPRVQAAFCIDVRSEVFRRALETVEPRCATIGFAGFFGFPIEYVPLGRTTGGAHCPALIAPRFVIRETTGTDDAARASVAGGASARRILRRRASKAWKSFKLGAVSSFGFVETMGLGYLVKLVTDSLGITRPVPHPRGESLDADARARLAPRLAPEETDGRRTGLTVAERLELAESALRAMSLTDGFARIVLLAGHGATTVNNPHATGLDCGACGGHGGEASARVAAAVLNDPAVRAGLAGRGIVIPDDTHFLAALHDTTTDEVTLFDRESVPATHAEDLARLEDRLRAATGIARAERAPLLHVETDGALDAAILARSRSWSQVRPEWGLAGCAAFVAAPRRRTAGADLGGRAFLHSYDWRADEGFGVLETIMTAPMIVASWISLAYYGSAVDNDAFGSGNKVLHNVVGALGVLEGNGGDLRVGLPWQSVHDGERLVHEPVRLSVVIEAPVEAMNDVIRRHAAVRQLLDRGWLHLFALDEAGRVSHRYVGGLAWRDCAAPEKVAPEAEVPASRHLGILGGGQLARMTAEAALRQGLRVTVLAEDAQVPAAIEGVELLTGSLDDGAALGELFRRVDCVTIENEFLDLERIRGTLDQGPSVRFRPRLPAIAAAQDKLAQKRILARLGIPAAEFETVSASSLDDDLRRLARRFPEGFVLKWSRFGYDGRGNRMVRRPGAIPTEELRRFCRAGEDAGAIVYAERRVDFTGELAMVSTRAEDGTQHVFPLVQSIQDEGICREVAGPATRLGTDPGLEREAAEILRALGSDLDMIGTFAVEFFLDRDGRLLVNEIAPRVHNTGHYTLFGDEPSQFDLHVQAVTGRPMVRPAVSRLAGMRNLLGPSWLDDGRTCPPPDAPPPPGIALHWYGKERVSPGRKMGHLTARADSPAELARLRLAMRDYEQRLWEALLEREEVQRVG